ncbi:hypothetical protein OEZ85_004123 [Tetradesmus obliquus]|uniref:Sulfotransferase domain-containing protein n=1 Tax=Tetradesmus obliquus TaxID=3088 RepID=A0ABY8UE20_TETOB|nr:hypothetical protein OEZ85_004123 [Tetradesmus obliquus]
MKLVFQLNDKGPKPTQFQQGMQAAIDKVANSSDFKYTAITSHIPYSEQAAELFSRPLMRFTSVRHPVARVHSHFIQTLCFWTAVRQGWKPFAPLNTSGPAGPSACDSGDDSTYMQLATANDTVEHRYDFARKHFQQNLMYWYMRGDVRGVEAAADQYDFIFVSERMNEALVIFMLQYGLTYEDIAYLPSKVRTGKYKTAKDMPQHLNDYILSVNQHDMQLWTLANTRLDEKKAELIDACGADIVSAALDAFEQLLDEIRAECSDYQRWYEEHGFDGPYTYSGSPGIGDESGLGFSRRPRPPEPTMLAMWVIGALLAAFVAAQEPDAAAAAAVATGLKTVEPDDYPLAAASAAPQHYWWDKPGSPHFRKPLYVYAWCGLAPESNSTDSNDYMATIDATPGSASFGRITDISNSPYSRTEAHHCGVDRSGKWLGAGGLTAFLQQDAATGQPLPDALFWDLSDPAHPKYSHGLYTPGGACTDEFRSLRAGGFAVTNMCGRTGSQGGGYFVVSPDARSLKEYAPYDTLSARNKKTLNPHGIDVDEDHDRALTSDFIDVSSTIITEMNQAPTPILQTTVRVWQHSTGTILKTLSLPKNMSAGNMDARRVPNMVVRRGHKDTSIKRIAQVWVTNGLGMLYHVDGVTGQIRRAYCLDDNCNAGPGTCIMSNPFKGGTRMLLAAYSLSQVRLLDISDTLEIKTLDIFQFEANAGGHVVKYDESTGIAAVSTYFLDVPGTILRFNADQKVSLFLVDLARDKLQLLGAVDFTSAVASKGPSSCHGLAFNSYYEY